MAKIALLIGVSEYEPGLNPLPAAVKDVEAMREDLQHPDIGAFDRVTVLANPDLLTMQRAISALFNDCHEEDLLLLYFSGHGITDEYGKFYFTNRSTQKYPQRNRLDKATGVAASFVHDQMENCSANRQVVILDCCNSGAFGENIPRDDGTIDFKQQLGGEGRIVLTSSAAIKYSFEREGEELAVYTRYLVEGIKTGAADLDEDGFVSANELHDYVKTKLEKAAPLMHPERYVSREGEKIILTKAAVGDPKRSYRKLVEQYSPNGEIRPAGRRILDRQLRSLALTREEAIAIEDEMLQPYREHQQNLKEYEEIFKEYSLPLSDRDQAELKDLQKELGLTDENVAAIAQKVTPLYTRPAQSASEIQAPQSLSQTRPVQPPPTQPESTQPQPRTPQRPSISRPALFHPSTRREVLKWLGFGGIGVTIAAFISQLFKPRLPSSLKENLGNGIVLEMVEIPGGKFLMGSPRSEDGRSDNESPQREVTVAPFQMGKLEVTQAQWKAVAALPKINIKLDLKSDPSKFKGANRPVESVSWDEVIEFCDRLSRKTGKQYRLPSEAEWEYACRGRTTTFYFGDIITTDLVNYDGNQTYGKAPKGTYRNQTTDVGSFSPNAFGLYDMHGNVWEWCADPWHGNYDRAPSDGRVWETESDQGNSRRLLRGGSWFNNPWNCRSANRFGYERIYRDSYIGFRVALSSSGTP